MKLAVDLDGVLFNFIDSFMDYIDKIGNPYNAKLYGKPVSWNMWEWMAISKQQFMNLLHAYSKDGGFQFGEFTDPHAIEKINNLAKKHEIIITTARHAGLDKCKKQIVDSTVNWLDFYNIEYHDLIFVRDKTLVNGDIFLDDGQHHLEALRDCGKVAVCYDQEYNKDWTGARVKNWEEFEKIISQYER